MGWERKRGKIEEFNRLLRGATDTSFAVSVGDLSDSAAGALLHHARQRHAPAAGRGARSWSASSPTRSIARPSTRGVGRVTEGYGILQPRISVTFTSAAGLAVRAPLCGPHRRRPLHDGGLRHLPGPVRRRHLHRQGALRRRRVHGGARGARCRRTRCCRTTCSRGSTRGWRSSPTSSWSTSIRRACCRTRGASIAGSAATGRSSFWLFPFVPSRHGLKRNTLPIIGRWKILDNLRRSLVAPTLLALLVAGWTVAARPAAGSGLMAVWAWPRRSCCRSLAPPADRPAADRSRSRSSSATCGDDAATALAQVAAQPDLPRLSRVATRRTRSCVTLVRLVVTRRRLLEWETAASAAAARPRDSSAAGPAAIRGRDDGQPDHRRPRVTAAVVAIGGRDALPAARAVPAPLWRSRPVVAYWLSVPVGARVRAAQRSRARAAAADGAQDVALLRNVRHRGDALAAAGQLPGERRTRRSWHAARRRPTSA